METAQLAESDPQDWLEQGFDEASPVDVNGAVGDVDLAEAVMRRDGSLIPLAMKLLREQSVWRMRLSPLGESKGSARFAVDVSFEGTNFAR